MTDSGNNYYATFIAVAEDCPVAEAEEPPARGKRTSAAEIHLGMARDEPYAYTQEQILFRSYLNAKGLEVAEHPEGGETWQEFFAKGQPCLRTSALAKRYGWGFHFDGRGRVGAVPVDSLDYQRFVDDPDLRQLQAMRSSRK